MILSLKRTAKIGVESNSTGEIICLMNSRCFPPFKDKVTTLRSNQGMLSCEN
jgi:hypothetical protein